MKKIRIPTLSRVKLHLYISVLYSVFLCHIVVHALIESMVKKFAKRSYYSWNTHSNTPCPFIRVQHEFKILIQIQSARNLDAPPFFRYINACHRMVSSRFFQLVIEQTFRTFLNYLPYETKRSNDFISFRFSRTERKPSNATWPFLPKLLAIRASTRICYILLCTIITLRNERSNELFLS